MKTLVLNGSPRQSGTISSLLKAVTESISDEHEIELIDVSKLDMKFCKACMTCREKGICAIRAVKEVLHYGGYKIVGMITKPGTKKSKGISSSMKAKARRMGKRIV